MKLRESPEPPASFGLDRETLAYIVLKARAFDVLVPTSDPDEGSNAEDDGFVEAISDDGDNPVARELASAIAALDVDARASLVALSWLGRGDYEAEDWDEALTTARARKEGSTARYLMGMPLLGDYLEEGAEKPGVDLIGEEEIGLSDPDLDTRAS